MKPRTHAALVVLVSTLVTACASTPRYSLDAHRELGLELRDPVLIPNAADAQIFFPAPAPPPSPRIRLIATESRS